MAKKKNEEPIVSGELSVEKSTIDNATDVKKVVEKKGRKDGSMELLRLRELNASLQDQLSKVSGQSERLSDELDAANAENSSLAKELKKLKQDYKKCQVDNKANSDLVESLHNELVRKESMLSEFKGSVSELQKNLAANKDLVAQQDKKINELGDEIAELTVDVAVRDNLINAYESMGFWKRLIFLFTGTKGTSKG